jgi:hypothetical protein
MDKQKYQLKTVSLHFKTELLHFAQSTIADCDISNELKTAARHFISELADGGVSISRI